MLKNPIFIIGCPRSGTTLIQNILSMNSQTFSLPETDYFSIIHNLKLEPDDQVSVKHLEKFIKELKFKNLINFSSQQQVEALKRIKKNDFSAKNLFEIIVKSGGLNEDSWGGKRLIEKTPRHYLFIDKISKTFLDAKFIHVARNPLDVIQSIMKTPFGRDRYVIPYARLWNSAILKINRSIKQIPDQIITVRYEDIVSSPEKTIQIICDFLKISYENQMLQNFGSAGEKNVGDFEYWKANSRKSIVIDGRYKWRQAISEGEAFFIEKITKRNRKLLGYEDQSSPDNFEILRAARKLIFNGIVHYSLKLFKNLKK